jgi:Amt family ammonium transporter
VHSIGGWAALAGALVVGPRIGKFVGKRVMPIPGHSMPLAALGMFVLMIGWFGFNAGSRLGIGTSGEGAVRSLAAIALNTMMGAAGGILGSIGASWWKVRKPDAGLTFNGALAGLVSITAGCATMAPLSALAAGFLGGALVVFGVLFLDRMRVDDPVGAISVHGLCGAWGTLAAGIFDATGQASVVVQALGVVVAFAWSFPLSYLAFKVMAATIGVRVSAEDEAEGLDLAEHAAVAYSELEP